MSESEFRFGPMMVRRTAHDDRMGFVITVYLDDTKEYVQIRCSPKGKSGLQVTHQLWGSKEES